METRGTVFEMCGEENGEACDYSAHETRVLMLGFGFGIVDLGLHVGLRKRAADGGVQVLIGVGMGVNIVSLSFKIPDYSKDNRYWNHHTHTPSIL